MLKLPIKLKKARFRPILGDFLQQNSEKAILSKYVLPSFQSF